MSFPQRDLSGFRTGGLSLAKIVRTALRSMTRAVWLASRGLRRDRTAFVYAGLTLALGFAVAAVNYSVILGFNRPLPVPHGEEVVRVVLSEASGEPTPLSLAEARLLAEQPVFERAGVFAERQALLASPGRPPLRLPLAAIEGVLETLGVAPLMGRLPEAEASATAPRPPRVGVLATGLRLFELYRLRLLDGRLFDDPSEVASDREGGPASGVAVVSEGFVRRHVANRDAVGRRLRLGDGEWVRIVGVVSDLRLVASDRRRGRPMVYLPLVPGETRRLTLSAEADGDGAARRIESVLRTVDPDLPLAPAMDGSRVGSLEGLLVYLLRIPRTLSWLALLGGLGATLVVGLGLYGVLAFEVEQRRAELGIRQALGADRRSLLRLVLKRGALRLAPGLVIGLALAWVVTPLFGVFLSGADARDPRIFAGLLVLYATMTVLAAAGPGRRAARADPASVLRSE